MRLDPEVYCFWTVILGLEAAECSCFCSSINHIIFWQSSWLTIDGHLKFLQKESEDASFGKISVHFDSAEFIAFFTHLKRLLIISCVIPNLRLYGKKICIFYFLCFNPWQNQFIFFKYSVGKSALHKFVSVLQWRRFSQRISSLGYKQPRDLSPILFS